MITAATQGDERERDGVLRLVRVRLREGEGDGGVAQWLESVTK